MASARDDGKRLRLTAFLIKDGYRDIESFLKVSGLHRLEVDKGSAKGTLFFRSGVATPPSWASIFEEVPGFDSNVIRNRNSRALYVTQVSKRWFCFTFGYARQLIEESAIERNFGLIVALNLGDPDAIKAIDKTNISHINLQSREQAGRDTGFDGFEFDTDIDLLKSITARGPVSQNDEQETYSGRDSVSVYTRVTLREFTDIAQRLWKAFQSTKYKRNYPWIDKITQERDPAVIAELDHKVVVAINQGDLNKIWLAIPEIINWEEVDGFAYRLRKPNPKKPGPQLHPDIDLEGWVTETKLKGHVTLNEIQHKKIFRCFKDDSRPPEHWSVYRCLNAEVDLKGSKYVLNDGDWYYVERNYVTEIDGFYQGIPDSALVLPTSGARNEPEYLVYVSQNHPEFALMDRKTVSIGGGKSQVEFCDLYSRHRDIIHVKKYGGSAPLSHLFNQAIVSGDCFLHERPFREAVNDLLPQGFKLPHPARDPSPAEYTVCVAIMSRAAGALELPFFSKVSLKHAVRSLQRMGFTVTKLKIER
jgi:uncharacterized protein (TIGR04141 family)